MTYYKSKGLEYDHIYVVDYQNFKTKLDEQPNEHQKIQYLNWD
jgi:ATP-dependent exoDNAse (exonuclease V) beta subunit